MIQEMTSFSSSETSSVSYQNGKQKPRTITVNKSNNNGFKTASIRMNKHMKKDLQEAMGLAGMAAIPSPYKSIYLTQYSHPCTSIVSGYGISNDIISDNMLVTNQGKLSLQEVDKLLENSNIKVFKYIGDKDIQSIYESILAIDDEDFIEDTIFYETITDKKLLSDDQLYIDEDFEEIDPNSIINTINRDICNIQEEVYGIYDDGVPIFTPELLCEAETYIDEDLLNNITIYESINGFYYRDNISNQRSSYYENIKDIEVL